MTSLKNHHNSQGEGINFVPEASISDEEFQTRTMYNRCSTTISHPADPTTEDFMSIVEASGSLDFWNHPDEDKYSENDGNAV